jgi:hypothetical protein
VLGDPAIRAALGLVGVEGGARDNLQSQFCYVKKELRKKELRISPLFFVWGSFPPAGQSTSHPKKRTWCHWISTPLRLWGGALAIYLATSCC